MCTGRSFFTFWLVCMVFMLHDCTSRHLPFITTVSLWWCVYSRVSLTLWCMAPIALCSDHWVWPPLHHSYIKSSPVRLKYLWLMFFSALRISKSANSTASWILKTCFSIIFITLNVTYFYSIYLFLLSFRRLRTARADTAVRPLQSGSLKITPHWICPSQGLYRPSDVCVSALCPPFLDD